MADPPPALSIVVVSRKRPAELGLCVAALTLQSHPRIEVVLVADAASLQLRPDLPLKRIRFDVANIAAARNLGIGSAAAEVIAFIDDDAVAEPTWAARLADPFNDPRVIAATGSTRGPDGMRWQVRAERIGPDGPAPLEVPGKAVTLLAPRDGTVLSTLGTNCAFRRDALLAAGGFDPAFAYHLDESDLNLRLAARFPSAASALVPLAEVTHGTAAGTVRDAARLPHDLRPIGRSAVIFARRHGGDPAAEGRRQRQRLLRLMVAGRLDPSRVAPLMATLAEGQAEAAALPAPPLPKPCKPAPSPAFRHLPTHPRPCRFIAGWHWQAARLRAEAAADVDGGAIVTLLLLTPTTLPHRASFTAGGWWEQQGGLWGPSLGGDPAVMAIGRRLRAEREQTLRQSVRCIHV